MQYGDIIVGSQLVDAATYLVWAVTFWIVARGIATVLSGLAARTMARATRGR